MDVTYTYIGVGFGLLVLGFKVFEFIFDGGF